MKGFSLQPLTQRLLRLLAFVMPHARAGWAEAMSVEAAYIEPELARLGFVAGCLRAACLARLEAALRRNASVLSAGLVMGAAFATHATVDGSRGWPLIWPLLGGALAVFTHGRNGKPLRPGRGASLGLQSGMLAGLLFIVAGMLLIEYFGRVTVTSRLDVLAIGALAGITLSVLGGSVAAALAPRR